MGKNKWVIPLAFLSLLYLGGFGQQTIHKNPNLKRFERFPVFLEIQKLTNCPVEILHLGLGKIQVRSYREGGSNITRKLAGSFEVTATTLKTSFWDAQPIIRWFHRLKNLKQLEKKTVSVIFRHPESRRLTRVNLWYAWPSEISLKQEGEFTAVYITFQAENIKILHPPH